MAKSMLGWVSVAVDPRVLVDACANFEGRPLKEILRHHGDPASAASRRRTPHGTPPSVSAAIINPVFRPELSAEPPERSDGLDGL